MKLFLAIIGFGGIVWYLLKILLTDPNDLNTKAKNPSCLGAPPSLVSLAWPSFVN
jgi:hypothetical protein